MMAVVVHGVIAWSRCSHSRRQGDHQIRRAKDRPHDGLLGARRALVPDLHVRAVDVQHHRHARAARGPRRPSSGGTRSRPRRAPTAGQRAGGPARGPRRRCPGPPPASFVRPRRPGASRCDGARSPAPGRSPEASSTARTPPALCGPGPTTSTRASRVLERGGDRCEVTTAGSATRPSATIVGAAVRCSRAERRGSR